MLLHQLPSLSVTQIIKCQKIVGYSETILIFVTQMTANKWFKIHSNVISAMVTGHFVFVFAFLYSLSVTFLKMVKTYLKRSVGLCSVKY